MNLKVDTKNYRDKVVIEKRKKVIYAVLKSALYRDLISSPLFWINLVGKLKFWVFHPNPYDPCIMKKVVGGILCTVCCHVSYLNISHVKSAAVDDVLRCLEEQYGKVATLTANWYKACNYLGMLLGFNKKASTSKASCTPFPWR